MEVSKTIPRKKREPSPDSFEGLRREAVKLTQQLSGDSWTDYNVHDPGITILEHVCYAVTDLIYRTGFPIQDYLATRVGELPLDELALHPAPEAMPCRATTEMDLRKAILDSVESLDNVWVTEEGNGLYSIGLRLDPSLGPSAHPEIIERVRKAFHAVRNLGEDLSEVHVLPEADYALIGAIDITSDAEPAEIVSEIYYRCAKRIADGVSVISYEDALSENEDLGAVFDGPLTNRGVIVPTEPRPADDAGWMDLFALVQKVDGVAGIRSLELRPVGEAQRQIEPKPRPVPRLKVPSTPEELRIALFKGSAEIPVSVTTVLAGYNKLRFRERSLRRSGRQPGAYLRTPSAQSRNFAAYSSIQEEFPAVYGINRFGIPASQPPARHAQALQLKAYLLLFEQVLANFLAQLGMVPQLFSPHGGAISYATQPIDGTVVPEIDEVYVGGDGKDIAATIWRENYDRHKYQDRKGRLLDYLLALYGDALSQFSLRRLEAGHGHDDRGSMLRNKIALLDQIIEVNRDRASGYDLTEPVWNSGNVSGLARRIGALLAIGDVRARPLAGALKSRGVSVVERGLSPDLFVDDLETERLGAEPEDGAAADASSGGDVFPGGTVSDLVLRYGSDWRRYAVTANAEGYRLLLDVAADPEVRHSWMPLSVHKEKIDAIATASKFRTLLKKLARESEGLFVIEHILLRPESFGSVHDENHDFYPFRISVVFPSWPPRFQNREFQKFAGDMVRRSCPAHIYPAVHWLDFEDMAEFENSYSQWLAQLAQGGSSARTIGFAASSLARFLRFRERAS